MSQTETQSTAFVDPKPRRTFTRELPHRLSPDEVRQYGQSLARRKREWDVLDTKRKQVAAEYKGQLATLGGEINRFVAAIDSGEEMRPVQVGEYIEGSQKVVRRLDTGEIVDQRPADLADLQEDLFPGFDDEPANDDHAPAVDLVTSSSGATVAVMPDDGDTDGEAPHGEAPHGEVPTAPAKKGRGKRGGK